ncbi:hypothetical protein LAZ67_7000842 [Cordylochernes scorpioides]|uniref:HTH CENPB-type domain-containing protein n=1 Tax=Cordylochernes scorpioides TaxID=51811 RepID=A0ABY6KNN0_9ARAC|nr:hypothetical protein LAZ67_7000842 [Cordylochernes scorpioides]
MEIIEEIEQGKSHSQVSRERNIPRSTISTIFKNKFAIKSTFLKSNFSSTLKRDRDGEFPEIEEALVRWIRQANAMKLTINGNILKEKAILLALKMGQDNFEASNGWLEKFKARRNIAFKRLHGEAGSADANSVATWKGGIIPSLLAKYSPQDIFNADETGFVMDEAMEEVVEEEMNRCFEALKKHQAIDVNYIDFMEVDKDVQVAGEQSIEEIVKEVMGKDEELGTWLLKPLLGQWNMDMKVTEIEDQRICIKFCVKNGFKGAEIFWMLQTAYGDAVMSRRRVFQWYKRFKKGREETADNERSGRPSTSTTPEKVDKVLELVREDRRITVREVAEEVGISFESTQSIMKDILGNARKETASLNFEATTDDPELLKRVITGDETWIYGFDSETLPNSKVKVMLTVFFDYQGIVHHEFQQQGSTITADSYLGSRFGPLRLLPLWKAQKKVKGSEISEHRIDQSGIEEGHEGDPENRLPEVFCRLEKKVAEVHRGQRGLL